jgi:midasin
LQEYIGSFVASPSGALVFQDGLLLRALRRGEWVILDELNLAPTEVLEALNRLLDDNRELYIPETNETVIPHPSFRLFATQNPSGAYGGRKPLSRAFRNRFVELHIGDIHSEEMVQILVHKCACPPSQAALLVAVMERLRLRRSKSGVFLGKDGFITPRDLLRWANRQVGSKLDLAREGYMLLAERLRTNDEKQCVQEELENIMKVKIEIDSVYYDDASKAHQLVHQCVESSNDAFIASVAPTRSLKRLVALVSRCIEQNEPVLLVGGKLLFHDPYCGSSTLSDILFSVYQYYRHWRWEDDGGSTVKCSYATKAAYRLMSCNDRDRGSAGKFTSSSWTLWSFLPYHPTSAAVIVVVGGGVV